MGILFTVYYLLFTFIYILHILDKYASEHCRLLAYSGGIEMLIIMMPEMNVLNIIHY